MTNEKYPTPLTSADWGEAWKQRQSIRNAPHDATYWNNRSATFGHKDEPGSYTDQFLKLTGALPGETVFDMGCGTGNLSVPLGLEGHEVVAADFSEGMLSRLEDRLKAKDISTVKPLILSWEEDWATKGVLPDSFDVCVASRSIVTSDLRESLLKLTSVAKRRICITLATGISPRIDERLMKQIGVNAPSSFDHIYALAILAAEGYFPELTYIKTKREDIFENYDDALEQFTGMTDAALETVRKSGGCAPARNDVIDRLRNWLDNNLIPANDLSSEDGSMRLKTPRETIWAFISWDK